MEKIGVTILIEKYAVIMLLMFVYFQGWIWYLADRMLRNEHNKS